jgi:hypothetical protein
MNGTKWLRAPGARGVALAFCVSMAVLPWLGGASLFAAVTDDVCALLLKERLLSEALDARSEAFLCCRRGRQEVCDELIAGRLTLAEAAERFERLSDELYHGVAVPSELRTASGRSGAYRHVIRWVGMALVNRPREQAELVARLERERARLEAAAAQPPR